MEVKLWDGVNKIRAGEWCKVHTIDEGGEINLYWFVAYCCGQDSDGGVVMEIFPTDNIVPEFVYDAWHNEFNEECFKVANREEVLGVMDFGE